MRWCKGGKHPRLALTWLHCVCRHWCGAFPFGLKALPAEHMAHVSPLPLHADDAAGGWHTVSEGTAATAAAASTVAPEPVGIAAPPGGSLALAGTAADQADAVEPPATGAAAASSPAAAGGQSGNRAVAVGAAAPDTAAAKPEAGVALAVPAYAHVTAHLVPDVEEDDYDAD